MNEEFEVDVNECSFTVTENGEKIWEGGNVQHAFLLRNINRETRKVFVNAKVDVTLDQMGALGQVFAKEEDQ